MENLEEKDWSIRSIKDFGAFIQKNKGIAGLCAVLMGLGTTVNMVNTVLLKRGLDNVDALLQLNDRILEERDQEREAFDQEREALKDLFNPCTKEQYIDLKIAQWWVQDRATEITVDAIQACFTYPNCPLTTEGAEAGFAKSFLENFYQTQFFCPLHDEVRVEEEAIFTSRASVEIDQDQDRVAQVAFNPTVFELAAVNPCELVRSEVHEWIHIAANERHDKNLREFDLQVDWPYYMGSRAYRDCVANPPLEWIGRIPADAAPY